MENLLIQTLATQSLAYWYRFLTRPQRVSKARSIKKLTLQAAHTSQRTLRSLLVGHPQNCPFCGLHSPFTDVQPGTTRMGNVQGLNYGLYAFLNLKNIIRGLYLRQKNYSVRCFVDLTPAIEKFLAAHLIWYRTFAVDEMQTKLTLIMWYLFLGLVSIVQLTLR